MATAYAKSASLQPALVQPTLCQLALPGKPLPTREAGMDLTSVLATTKAQATFLNHEGEPLG